MQKIFKKPTCDSVLTKKSQPFLSSCSPHNWTNKRIQWQTPNLRIAVLILKIAVETNLYSTFVTYYSDHYVILDLFQMKCIYSQVNI